MRTQLLPIATLLCAAVLLAGCFPPGALTGSGRLETRDYDITDFDTIEATHGFQVEVIAGDTYAVSVTVDDNLMQYVLVEKQGARLSIGLERNRIFALRSAGLRASVTMPNLAGANLSGGSRLTTPSFEPAGFNAELSGGSRLQGAIDTGQMTLSASGGSQVALDGSARELSLAGSGGSRFDMEGFSAQSATVSLSGGSQATTGIAEQLDYDLAGGSRLTYLGNPTKGRTNVSGGSQATQR